MKLKWRRRGPRRAWLLLRPGAAAQPWDWLLVERGVPSREGQGEPPNDLDARVALIIPGQLCSHFQLPAPPGLKRDEWPLLLEDRLLQASDQLLFACIERLPGQLRLALVERAQLDGWRKQCADWGLSIERCWAQLQLLPASAPGAGWRWPHEHEDLYKGVASDGREHWLSWPRGLGDPPAVPWATLRIDCIEGRWPAQLVALDSLPSLFEQRRVRARLSLPRGHLRLVAACLILATAWAGLWLSQQWHQAQLYRQQVLAVTGEQASLRQASVALKRLRDAASERQLRLRKLDGLQGQLQAWLEQHPGWRLQAVRFDGQRWHVHLDGEGPAPAWQDMANQAGAQVEVNDAGQAAQWRVVFDLGAV
ncbi:GspL/Epsl periplasmic domain-containing protein [Pseudomonas urmiensis]|uniref:GspL/Epsl periplasmic domain-containing protein n=1 Tax=Pseudomonas urmiensis TaxID=2745493 RepID=UPI0034D710AB